jgi:1,4-alpha-glucan branching enzyme
MSDTRATWTPLGEVDLHLLNEGTHERLYDCLGAHVAPPGEPTGTFVAVWAPSADAVTLVSDRTGWDEGRSLDPVGSSGVWQGFVPDLGVGEVYKYRVHHGGSFQDKADPVAAYAELSPKTGSVVWDLAYAWGDDAWMATRGEHQRHDRPMSVYEVHLGSWRRPHDGRQFLTYREVAEPLADHVVAHGFTHVELLPVMEHPFYGSWGYQTTGYFAPTSRYGTPQDLMFLIDHLHQRGIGVIFDWVPSHFPDDPHGLARFDGTHLYEHADPRQGFHPDWNSLIFNYGRNEVRSFLLSSALSWLDRYHVDGLRVDAVASMLYLDYSRKEGEWIPNRYGGRENLEAIDFLRQLNEVAYDRFPDIHTTAEESTAWPGVSRPTHLGGLGFGFKWDMGWMHDTLEYLQREAVHRRWHHGEVTFRAVYASTENYVLPLSHDEVVHGKRSLLEKMPGDDWQRFANLRLLLGMQWAQPGKKLLFMGGELAQRAEWSHEGEVEWHQLDHDAHRGIARWVADLNDAHRRLPALHELDTEAEGFAWVDSHDAEHSVFAWLRLGRSGEAVLVVANATPVPLENHRIGVDREGHWRELLNSDADVYGGSGWGNYGGRDSTPVPAHGRPFSLNLTLPPLGVLFLDWAG